MIGEGRLGINGKWENILEIGNLGVLGVWERKQQLRNLVPRSDIQLFVLSRANYHYVDENLLKYGAKDFPVHR